MRMPATAQALSSWRSARGETDRSRPPAAGRATGATRVSRQPDGEAPGSLLGLLDGHRFGAGCAHVAGDVVDSSTSQSCSDANDHNDDRSDERRGGDDHGDDPEQQQQRHRDPQSTMNIRKVDSSQFVG